ncbi:conserved hypothetical protein [Candidatus Terasakiella magnetica]|uniref:Aminoglycoside phosphotransferase domain-containing protein n=1 Tax=Candidatus Terasakiella magnetica TaxID=1867952 RepID=A0A1C3RI85_9PROT|nr:bifunctional aminoglycoside phosphotransferase/ATP-binding protein [Candidatus Terasakiella magnetica]SCA56934.1 conserved hypothetical protein [Candidatus Terasakiella magnetica]
MQQSEVIEFLSKPETYGLPEGERVERFDTHISIVFLAGPYAYKLKRAIALPFVDFSTLEDREKYCRLELEINKKRAENLYVDVIPVCFDQVLSLDTNGSAVDWLVKMKRFDQDQLFDFLCEKGSLSAADMEALTDHIVSCYEQAEVNQEYGGASGIKRAFEGHYQAFESCPEGVLPLDEITALKEKVAAEIKQHEAQLEDRCKTGYVRKCHGDLHLRNICYFQDQITLFDAIEFEPDYEIIDVLYDLAFLLMDLCHRGRLDLANVVMNRYMGLTGDVSGLNLLGLFLSSRAIIRTHVNAVASQNQASPEARNYWEEDARHYLDEAQGYLEKGQKPALIAIGGLSGTGKSRLAMGLAPELGQKPGAYIARTDMIRKRIMRVKPHEKLSEYGYRESVTKHTYNTLYVEAQFALHSGYCVIVDGVFAKEEERTKLAEIAQAMEVPFAGFWLEAPQEVLEKRVAARENDASDADVEIVKMQAGYELGEMTWQKLDATLTGDELIEKAQKYLTKI